MSARSNQLDMIDVCRAIRRASEKAGSQAALARLCAVSTARINQLLNGQGQPSDRVLEACGLRRVVEVHYEYME